jgi:trimeric autotransporter adhesin
MRSLHLLASICIVIALALCGSQVAIAQYTISTVAGGGPNNLPALQSSLGLPEAVALDAAGNAYIADSNANQVLKVSVGGTVTVVAGNGTAGYSGDGGPAISAALGAFGPQGIFVDGSGNIFIADTQNSVIREVAASTGDIKTVVGISYDSSEGSSCQYLDNVQALSAYLCLPYSVFVDVSGNIYIADTGNSAIREVVASTGAIQTVAGTPGTPGYSGNGPAISALLDIPEGVFVDPSGNIYIADTYNSIIREVTIANGNIQTVAGTYYAYDSTCNYSGDGAAATSANLCLPGNVSLDSSGDLFIADTYNFAIRKVSGRTINTVAGTPTTVCATYLTTGCGNNGAAIASDLNYPSDMVVDSSGNIYIADSEDSVIREVTASNLNIRAFAGNGFISYSGDGGTPTNAELGNPVAVFVDASGNVFIADTDNSVIREILASTGDIQTVAGNGNEGYSGDSGLATKAELDSPQGVYVDAQGDIFIADNGNNVIREVVASTGNIQTVAGNGTLGYSGDGGAPISAELNNPYGVLVDVSGNIYIADAANHAIRVVNTGAAQITVAGTTIQPNTIQTVAGTPPTPCDAESTVLSCGDGGLATKAYLNFPLGIFLDTNGDIFIADSSDNAIREVSATTGIIQTMAGTIGATGGFSGDGAAATSALLDTPSGVFADTTSDIFIADSENDAIREVVASTGFIQIVAGIPATTGGLATPGFSGDGGAATSAELNFPSAVFATPAGKLFIADTDNSRIRELAPASLTVTVAPSSATVVVNALQQYTATVTGNSNTNVSWFVDGVPGGNSTVGTISATGSFQAPAAVPSPATVTISAISQVDNTTSGTASATIASPSATVTVTVSTNPTVTQVYTGSVQPFIAAVTGSSNTAVTWYVQGTQGGDTTFGTIDTSGNYTAPANVPSPATITIEAVSQADATASGTEQVTIVAAPTAMQPAAQTVSPGGTATYSLTLTGGSPSQPVTLSCLQSSLPSGATCVFSQNGQTVTTITPSGKSVPFTLAVSVPASSASLTKPGGFWHASPMYAAFIPLAGFLLLGAKPRHQRRRWGSLVFTCVFLLALVACGGGSSGSTPPPPSSNTYTIQVHGTTAAQPNPVTITTVSLTVQ